MGLSYAFRRPVAPFIAAALVNSAKLAGLAFVIVVPLGIAGGVYAALHAGRWQDRAISSPAYRSRSCPSSSPRSC